MAKMPALNSWLRYVILLFAAAGTLACGAAFTLSYAKPAWIEHIAKEIIYQQVTSQVNEKIDALNNTTFAVNIRIVTGKLQEQIRQDLPERITAVIAQMQNPDSEYRNLTPQQIHSDNEWHFSFTPSLTQLREKLNEFIRAKYTEALTHLHREYRIFTGTHTLVFACLVATLLIYRSYKIQLLPLAFLLFIASLINAYLYIFQQNWLHTILFSDYTGFAYITYMCIIFASLCDLVFYKGRINNLVIDTIENIASSLPTRAS